MPRNEPPELRPKASKSWLERIPSLSDDPTHPAQIALRTYALALSLSLGPSLIPFVAALVVPPGRTGSSTSRTGIAALKRVLRRELGHDGFAFPITLSMAGGAALRRCWELWKAGNGVHEGNMGKDQDKTIIDDIFLKIKAWFSNLTPEQATFLATCISSSAGILLLQAGRERTSRLKLLRGGSVSIVASPKPTAAAAKAVLDLTSPTLDLTLLLLVRAIDSVVQSVILQRSSPVTKDNGARTAEPQLVREKLERMKIAQENKLRQKMTSQVDAFMFWASSARIMWCFFYEPHRLPRSYVKWIYALANLDGRLITTLQYIRDGSWSYISGSPLHASLLRTTATKHGHPASWGNPNLLPAYGGAIADEAWKRLGVTSRPGVGGLPCEVLHASVGKGMGLNKSCTANAGFRMSKGFLDALAIYLPVHFLPVLITRPQSILRPHRLFETFSGAVRSATFLSSFIGMYWYAVCLTRTVVLARLFPFISHDFWDGPYGCVMAGCLMCGSSIWIENGRRRGEMALYVLPRAIRAWLPDRWVKSGNRGVKLMERLAFILSMATLLTAATHRPDTLRGLSRWTLAFVTNGPNAGFWKRQRRDPSVPPTPSVPATPATSQFPDQGASASRSQSPLVKQ